MGCKTMVVGVGNGDSIVFKIIFVAKSYIFHYTSETTINTFKFWIILFV